MKPSEALSFKRPLRAHQAAALDRFAYESEAALLWEMGLGKTTEAIQLLRVKYNIAKEVVPTLVVSPVATLYNWKEEFEINAPEKVSANVLVPYMRSKKTKLTTAERAHLIRTSGQKIVIVNPEVFDFDVVVDALREFRPRCLIVDESDLFKAHSSKRLKKLLTISDLASFRVIMTGTPILNSYLDIWAQWRILDRGDTFGLNFFTFRERYFADENIRWKGKPKYFPKYVPKAGIESELSKLIGTKASRLMKSECLDLPEQVFEKYHVELGAEQKKAYFQMESQMIAEVKAGTCAAVNALAKVLRMLQILSGYMPVEVAPSSMPAHDGADAIALSHFHDNPRLLALRELLEKLTPAHKVIVWANFTANYVDIRKVCEELSLEFAEITGETKDRQAEKERFQTDPKCRVMLSNPQAGGAGINLTASSYAIYYSRNYSLRQRLQSLARNHRDGSQIHESITVIDLVSTGTMEDDVLAALLRKETFSENVLGRLQGKYAEAES
jgi:SNF2 family DNA or RNA helicase